MQRMTTFEVGMRSEVFILTGSNLGSREYFLHEARTRLERSFGECIIASSVYESQSWGYNSSFPYLNQVLKFITTLSPEEVLYECLNVETNLGRVRSKETNIDRTIDIDILFYNDLILTRTDLTIPHPRIVHRRFVLLPLVEISPSMLHPIEGKTLIQLLDECEDPISVDVYQPNANV